MIGANRLSAAESGSSRMVAAGCARHRLLALLILIPLALILGCVAGAVIGRIAATSSDRDQRLAQISADLHSIRGDYLLALGDSHVARWHGRELCGLPLVNAGLHGATTADADDLLSRLSLSRPPRAIILTVGTNDANRKRFREPPEAVVRFRNAFRTLLTRMFQTSGLVVVTSLPPIDARQVGGFSPEVASDIAEMAQATCRKHAACRVGAGFGEGIPLSDGLHLADYERAYQSIAQPLCAALSQEPSPARRQNADAGAP